jgi:phosphate transport system permease protein
MAVTFVIGNAPHIQSSILAQGTTISAMIANSFADADPGLFTQSLLALGFILFIITFIVLAAARLMLARLAHKG